jgi:ADP-ribosylglycohydrolase
VAAINSAAAAAAAGPPSRHRISTLGQGWVGEEALAIGLYAAMVATTFEACIELAANHDGDSDSTASIAGQLWGARHGLDATLVEVVNRLDVQEPLFDIFHEWSACPWSARLTP